MCSDLIQLQRLKISLRFNKCRKYNAAFHTWILLLINCLTAFKMFTVFRTDKDLSCSFLLEADAKLDYTRL